MVLCCSNEKEAAKLFGLYLDHKISLPKLFIIFIQFCHLINTILYQNTLANRSLSKMSSHNYQIKFKTERIVEILYGCYRYRQFVTDIDTSRAEASAIFSLPFPSPAHRFLAVVFIPSSAISIPSNFIFLKASAEERVQVQCLLL